MRVVLDTNVLVAALRSSLGASYRVLGLVGTGRFEIALSVPLVLEYEDALLRHAGGGAVSREDVDTVLDYLCSIGHRQEIFFLWRPLLADPKDDMVLELAVAAQCNSIVTFNTSDFASAHQFGIDIITPRHFLNAIGARP